MLTPPYEDLELRLVFNEDGTVDLVGEVSSGRWTGFEFIIARDLQLLPGGEEAKDESD